MERPSLRMFLSEAKAFASCLLGLPPAARGRPAFLCPGAKRGGGLVAVSDASHGRCRPPGRGGSPRPYCCNKGRVLCQQAWLVSSCSISASGGPSAFTRSTCGRFGGLFLRRRVLLVSTFLIFSPFAMKEPYPGCPRHALHAHPSRDPTGAIFNLTEPTEQLL